ncbi:hypothetical protein [Streptococcus henryi]|uniref:hypothetical protein n=1 Tax=Streptococcus henryi TaxID=439219 RepID=UPI00036EB46A|nr:hypothetical protein [Streptococcus henryi]
MLVTIFLACHFIVITLIYFGAPKWEIQLNVYHQLLLLFFPILGPISVIYLLKDKKSRSQKDKLSFEEVIPWLSNDKDVKDNFESSEPVTLDITNIVPFQEALLLNNSSIKRELIIDVIFESPENFVSLLNQARLNDDVEVVHYATTILSELSAKYDENLHRLEHQVKKNPDSFIKRCDLSDFLERYIKSEIAEGHYGKTLKQKYIHEIEWMIEKNFPVDKKRLISLARTYQSLENFEALDNLITNLFNLFPDDQDIWMLYLDTIILKKSGSELEQFWEFLGQNNIYFSEKNKVKLNFWRQHREATNV